MAPPGPLRTFWLSFSENKGAVAGLVVLILVGLVAVFADVLAPYSPLEQLRGEGDLAGKQKLLRPAWTACEQPPDDKCGNWKFVLGTDGASRDTLSRLIHGARLSLFIGLAVMLVSIVFGVLLGLIAAFSHWSVDFIIMRVMDLVMAVPGLVLAILIVAILGPSLTNTIVAVTIVFLPRYVRLVRASAISELSKEYVTAAKVSGVRLLRLMFVTVLPNCLAPLTVQAALGVSEAILEAAALGFLGLGAQPPAPEWGAMLADNREFIRSDPWVMAWPGLAILVTVVSINLVGDGLRDALDPKLQRS
jgi:dipeptide transport system permease protein